MDSQELCWTKISELSEKIKSNTSLTDSISSKGDFSENLVEETLLIVDTETTGLDVEKDHFIEGFLLKQRSNSNLKEQDFRLA